MDWKQRKPSWPPEHKSFDPAILSLTGRESTAKFPPCVPGYGTKPFLAA